MNKEEEYEIVWENSISIVYKNGDIVYKEDLNK